MIKLFNKSVQYPERKMSRVRTTNFSPNENAHLPKKINKHFINER